VINSMPCQHMASESCGSCAPRSAFQRTTICVVIQKNRAVRTATDAKIQTDYNQTVLCQNLIAIRRI
jgi:hypothetical protein